MVSGLASRVAHASRAVVPNVIPRIRVGPLAQQGGCLAVPSPLPNGSR